MQNRTTPERPKLPAQCLTLPCTGNYIGPHVLTPRGLVPQYTASSQKLVADHPEIAFPDGDNVATFIGCFTRSNANKNNPMIDETSSRQAVLFLFQFDPETDNSQANRRLLGESAATQLTSHANTTLMTGLPTNIPAPSNTKETIRPMVQPIRHLLTTFLTQTL
jgi:hypothetical protein